jgi:hypothetical protein
VVQAVLPGFDDPVLPALEAFNLGFADGWKRAPRQKNLGATYLRAYARGVEARDRDENGGEIVTAPSKRRKVA